MEKILISDFDVQYSYIAGIDLEEDNKDKVTLTVKISFNTVINRDGKYYEVPCFSQIDIDPNDTKVLLEHIEHIIYNAKLTSKHWKLIGKVESPYGRLISEKEIKL